MVCRIIIGSQGYGTGWVFGRHLVVTARHVVLYASGKQVAVEWYDADASSPSRTTDTEIQIATWADFAAVFVRESLAGAGLFGITPTEDNVEDEPILLAGYQAGPSGGLSVFSGAVSRDNGGSFEYDVPTPAGFSGAPVRLSAASDCAVGVHTNSGIALRVTAPVLELLREWRGEAEAWAQQHEATAHRAPKRSPYRLALREMSAKLTSSASMPPPPILETVGARPATLPVRDSEPPTAPSATTPTRAPSKPADPALRDVWLEAERARLDRAIAEDRSRAAAAIVGNWKFKPPESSVAVDDPQQFASSVLAYQALPDIATQVAKLIKDAGALQVVVHDDLAFAAIDAYRSFSSQADLLCRAFRAAIPRVERSLAAKSLAGFEVGLAAARAGLGLLSSLRTSVQVVARILPLEEGAVVAEVARQLHPACRVLYPGSYSPTIDVLKSASMLRLEQLLNERVHAASAALRQTAKDPKDSSDGTNDEPRPDPTRRLALEEERLDQMLQSFSMTDPATGLHRFGVIVRGEWLNGIVSRPGTLILQLKVLRAGGTLRISRGFLDVIRGRTRISRHAAIAVTVLLFDQTGAIRASKTLFAEARAKETD